MGRESLFGWWALVGACCVLTTGAAEAPAAAKPAADELAAALTLPRLIAVAVEHSPQVKAARADWEAAIERYPQMTALPDPMVGFNFMGTPDTGNFADGGQQVEFEQSFPFPGMLAAAGRVALKEVAMQRLMYEQAVRDLIVDLKLSFHERAYLERATELTRQNQELMAQLLKVANARYAEDRIKLADVLRAQSQLAQLSYDLVLLGELREVETARLNALLDRPTTAPLGATQPGEVTVVEASLAAIESQALARRQELLVARQEVARSADAVSEARWSTFPMFTLKWMPLDREPLAMTPMGMERTDAWSVGVAMTIPLWQDKNRGVVREAKLQQQAAAYRRQALENDTRSQLRAAWFRLENARRLIELYEKSLIPQARQAMSLAETWQKQDQVEDLSGFLETQSVWLNFNLARLRAVTDYQQNLARLERLVGGRVQPPAKDKVTP